jgi:hypothetical protein
MTRNIHIHLHDASSVIQPTKPAASPKTPSPKPTTPPKSSTPPGSSNKPIHQAPTKPPAHEPLLAKSTEVVKKTGEAINKTSEAIERHRQQVTDDMSRTTKGVRVWGESPKKALAADAGTSEGAKKAAQTRKAHGGGGATAQPAAKPKGTWSYHTPESFKARIGALGTGQHSSHEEALAHAKRKHGPTAFATYGKFTPTPSIEPSRRRGYMPD